ncbi:MAG: dihydropteroate synthase [Methanosarcinales archaeon]|nr:dihydropteroate synthase [Methanosarcinales archaeon]
MMRAFDLTIEGTLCRLKVGDLHPVGLMAVINLSEESFYKGSVATPDHILSLGSRLAEEGADLIDLGAVSTAPGSPPISEEKEMDRLFPALNELADNLEVGISVDTSRSRVARAALCAGATCINDVSCLADPLMARVVADHQASLILMASRRRPGDLLSLNRIIPRLGQALDEAEAAGIERERMAVDPGIGRWIPEKTADCDLAILEGFRRLRVLGRPMVAALSRKSFIGTVLGEADPGGRLAGSLAATAVAVYNGAHLVRTHDVAATLPIIRMAEAIRAVPCQAGGQGIEVELLGSLGNQADLSEALRQVAVGEGGERYLCLKGAFRILSVQGISAMEAVIIKQEMLARGGDAAIPRKALRCDPSPMGTLIFGTVAQISSMARKLKEQPFNLPVIGEHIETVLKSIEG